MRLLSLMLMLQIIPFSVMAKNKLEDSTSSFYPHGNVNVTIYSNFHMSDSKVIDVNNNIQHTQYSAFEITRAYFGYDYNINKNLIGFVKLDVGKGAVSEYTAFLKNAGLSWGINKKLTLNFGLINTLQFDLQEHFWGKRYLYKSFQDQYDFGSSADAGVTINYLLNEHLKIDVGVFNGEGYKKAQDINGQLQYATGVTIMPIKGLSIKGYFDISSISTTNKDTLAGKNSLSTFIGYKNNTFSIGAEYNIQHNNRNLNQHNLSGISIYGAYWINPKLRIFGRFDKLYSNKIHPTDNKDWNDAKDENVFIGGVEYKAIKNVSLSVNYRNVQPQASSNPITSSLYANLQIKL